MFNSWINHQTKLDLKVTEWSPKSRAFPSLWAQVPSSGPPRNKHRRKAVLSSLLLTSSLTLHSSLSTCIIYIDVYLCMCFCVFPLLQWVLSIYRYRICQFVRIFVVIFFLGFLVSLIKENMNTSTTQFSSSSYLGVWSWNSKLRVFWMSLRFCCFLIGIIILLHSSIRTKNNKRLCNWNAKICSCQIKRFMQSLGHLVCSPSIIIILLFSITHSCRLIRAFHC